jgi:hypothetical protein
VSLTSLINQNKTTDSNPLINTARLRDEQGVYINPFQFREGKYEGKGGLTEITGEVNNVQVGGVD